MLSNLIGASGKLATTKFSKNVAFGDFRLTREVKTVVSSGSGHSKRKFKTSEQYTALGNVDVVWGPTLNDSRGYNASMIDESGDVTGELLAAKLRAWGGISRPLMTEIQAAPELYLRDDSQIALLVALLSTYYTLESKDAKFVDKLGVYDDGHVKINLDNVINTGKLSDKWQRDTIVDCQEWDQTMIQGIPSRPVLYCGKLSGEEVAILQTHLSGRNKTTKLAFDLEMPALAESVMIAGRTPATAACGNVTAAKVLLTLNKYVESNRLHGAMETAYAIMLQTALIPIPDTAEGAIWLKRRRSVVLPRFDAMRGAYHILIMEKSFGMSASVIESWKLWREVGLGLAAAHGVFNALSLWGRYFVEAGYYYGDSEVDRLGCFDFAEAPAAAYYAYASLITGQETYCAVPGSYGLRYDQWTPKANLQIPIEGTDLDIMGYEVDDDETPGNLLVNYLPEPSSIIHLLGRMPRDGMFSAFSDRNVIRAEQARKGWVFGSVRDAWAFGIATRILGYNVMMEYRGLKKLANWASNDSSLAVRPFQITGRDNITVNVRAIEARANCFDVLPDMTGSSFTWTIEHMVSENVTLHAMKGYMPMKGTFIRPTGKATVEVSVNAPECSSIPVMIKAMQRSLPGQAGFQICATDTAPHPPEPTVVLAESELADDAVEPDLDP